MRLKLEADRLAAERLLLAADGDRIQQQRAELERERATVRATQQEVAAREAAAAARERDADGLIAVVEAIEAEAVSFDDDGRPVAATSGSPEQQALLARIEKGGNAAKRFLVRAGRSYGHLRALAAAAAEQRLRAEFAAAAEAMTAANRFLRKAMMALPVRLRAGFRKEISVENAQLLDAREHFDEFASQKRKIPKSNGEIN